MSPESQRIAIAEACGWRSFDDNEGSLIGVPPHNAHLQRSMAQRCVPDYLNDLNAMHEAEKVIGSKQKPGYCSELWNLCVTPNSNHEWKMLHATAAQRAQAFLMTLGLWKDK